MGDFFKELLPVKDQRWSDDTIPLVSISCIAYNQGEFIGKTLDGFINQRTSFPVEVLIHDDASTDDTADIIRAYEFRYPHIIKPIYQVENQYRKGIKPGRLNFNRAKGTYYATCEGDDYWDDPSKLQLQVDFLEKNQDYALVYTDFRKVIQKTGELKEYKAKEISGLEDLLKENNIGTLTVCTRLKQIQEFYNTDYKELPEMSFGDYQRWLYLSTRGKFKRIDRFCAVYRVLEHSASHSPDEKKIVRFNEDIQKCKEFFINKYLPDRKDLKRKAEQVKLIRVLSLALVYRNKELFLKYSNQIQVLKNHNRRLLLILYLAKINFPIGSWLFRLQNKQT